MPSSVYSTGSSTVLIFTPGLLRSLNIEYKVVDLPLPVGPTTITIPYGDLDIFFIKLNSSCSVINFERLSTELSLSSALSTTFSPHLPGNVLTRKSDLLPLKRHLILPS